MKFCKLCCPSGVKKTLILTCIFCRSGASSHKERRVKKPIRFDTFHANTNHLSTAGKDDFIRPPLILLPPITITSLSELIT